MHIVKALSETENRYYVPGEKHPSSSSRCILSKYSNSQNKKELFDS